MFGSSPRQALEAGVLRTAGVDSIRRLHDVRSSKRADADLIPSDGDTSCPLLDIDFNVAYHGERCRMDPVTPVG
jgi:hypothetical protein